jgi:hypothetical protein
MPVGPREIVFRALTAEGRFTQAEAYSLLGQWVTLLRPQLLEVIDLVAQRVVTLVREEGHPLTSAAVSEVLGEVLRAARPRRRRVRGGARGRGGRGRGRGRGAAAQEDQEEDQPPPQPAGPPAPPAPPGPPAQPAGPPAVLPVPPLLPPPPPPYFYLYPPLHCLSLRPFLLGSPGHQGGRPGGRPGSQGGNR